MAKELREKSLLRKSKLLIPIQLVVRLHLCLFLCLFLFGYLGTSERISNKLVENRGGTLRDITPSRSVSILEFPLYDVSKYFHKIVLASA